MHKSSKAGLGDNITFSFPTTNILATSSNIPRSKMMSKACYYPQYQKTFLFAIIIKVISRKLLGIKMILRQGASAIRILLHPLLYRAMVPFLFLPCLFLWSYCTSSSLLSHRHSLLPELYYMMLTFRFQSPQSIPQLCMLIASFTVPTSPVYTY